MRLPDRLANRDPGTEMTHEPALAGWCALPGMQVPHWGEARRVELWADPNIRYHLEQAYHSCPNRGGGIRRFEAAS